MSLSPIGPESRPMGIAPPVVGAEGPLVPAFAPETLEAYPESLPKGCTVQEAVQLAALDTEFYNRTFFPNTFRQSTPDFHRDVYRDLESRKRLLALKIFRGGAKTTILRSFASKRIAYGSSRTIVFVGKNQDHSIRSVAWIKRAVEYNRVWASVFGLRPGSVWKEDFIQIWHETLGHPITVMAYGITGGIRGINIDDWRPDLIVVDDPCDEENTATQEQREKVEDRFFGALLQSLAPASEAPEAKQVLLQTPLNPQDLISSCEKDPAWTTATYGILDEGGNSRWPSRWSTQEVLEERQSYADRGQLPLWTREKQCTIIAKELSDFRAEWIRYWDVLPPQMPCFLWIDPVPPPSDRELQTGLKNKDHEALAVVGIHQGNYYLLDYRAMKGHDPEWTIKTFFELYRRWHFLRAGVEGVAYQRTLKWILDRAMRMERTYVQVDAITDKRSKRHRILQSLSGPCSQGRFYCHKSHVEFMQQFLAYPNVAHEDTLEAVAGAVKLASDSRMESGIPNTEDETKPLPQTWRSAP